MQLYVMICSLVAMAIGVLLGWFANSLKANGSKAAALAEMNGKDCLLIELRNETDRLRLLLDQECFAHRLSCEALSALRAGTEAEQRASQEKIATLLGFEENLKRSFESLAANALDSNSRRLLDLNRSELEKQRVAAAKELGEKESSIGMLLKPMKDSLEQLASHSRDLEVKREGAYQSMIKEIENIQRSHTDLRRETTQLVQALRAPKARGNWGEMQLRRCVEYAGMLEHASFDTEKLMRDDDSAIRPDLIVRLPNDRCIIVDAKTPLDAFLNAGGCDDELVRQKLLADHASAVRKHLDSLASKSYWTRFSSSPDFVVCFLPSEVLFSAALEQDPSLLEHSAGGKVLLATPTTLIALLKAVAYGWQQSQIARDAQIIRDAATKVHSKLAAMHAAFLDIGKHLRRAGDCYDDALVKAEGRGGLFSIVRQLRELKIGEKDIKEGSPIALRPKSPEHEDWQFGLSLAASDSSLADADRS